MALESRESTRTRGSNTSRIMRGFARAALSVVALISMTATLRAQGGDKAKVGDAVKADLTRLAELERGWYEKNRTFTTDLRALGFTPTSGANLQMSYASARSWAANATHPTLQSTTCFIVVSQPGGAGANDRPFCNEASDAKQVAVAPRQQPAAPPKATPKSVTPKSAAPKLATPKSTALRSTAPRATAPGSQLVVTNRRGGRRTPPVTAPAATAVATTVLEVPARAPSNSAALANTRAAGGAADAGVTEAVTPVQFTERLNAFVTAALELQNTRMPEVVRDPYESTVEYQARVALAYAAFQRRDAEYYARNARTFVVSIPVKGVKYDPDREIVEFSADPIAMPTARSFSAVDGARMSVACYTRPYFWCSPDTGMLYDGTDLWHIPRAAARSADLLVTPMTLVARFVIGWRDDARSPAVSLMSMELRAKGTALSRWDSGTR